MEGVEVVVLGCGVPGLSMGWVHVHQLLTQPIFSDDIHSLQVILPRSRRRSLSLSLQPLKTLTHMAVKRVR